MIESTSKATKKATKKETRKETIDKISDRLLNLKFEKSNSMKTRLLKWIVKRIFPEMQ